MYVPNRLHVQYLPTLTKSAMWSEKLIHHYYIPLGLPSSKVPSIQLNKILQESLGAIVGECHSTLQSSHSIVALFPAREREGNGPGFHCLWMCLIIYNQNKGGGRKIMSLWSHDLACDVIYLYIYVVHHEQEAARWWLSPLFLWPGNEAISTHNYQPVATAFLGSWLASAYKCMLARVNAIFRTVPQDLFLPWASHDIASNRLLL